MKKTQQGSHQDNHLVKNIFKSYEHPSTGKINHKLDKFQTMKKHIIAERKIDVK